MSVVPGAAVVTSILGLACLCWPAAAGAQATDTFATPARTEPLVRVTVDLAARTFDRVLPFDVPFIVVGTAPEGTVRVAAQHADVPRSGSTVPSEWKPSVPASWQSMTPVPAGDTFRIPIRDPLDARRAYSFRFTVLRQPSLDQTRQFRELARSLLDRRPRSADGSEVSLATTRAAQLDLAAAVRSVAGPAAWQPIPDGLFDTDDGSPEALQQLLQDAGSPDAPHLVAQALDRLALAFRDERFRDEEIVVEGETARHVYVSADAGLLYATDIGTAAFYVGSNIYFRPVNKRAPLGWKGSFFRRVALTLGFTVTSIADEDERTRSDMFAHQSLVLGAGLRLTPSVRAGAGALVFKEHDPNPLITKTSVATTPYVSLSFDLDVGSTFQRLGW